jgi:16S rRNA (cytosine1402-N4)-methyltransferase
VNGGGHTRAIAKRMQSGKILATDLDNEILKETKKEFQKEDVGNVEIFFEHSNYVHISEILKQKKLGKVDGLLLDLGFSSEHLESGRGFSFREEKRNEPLDMRYDESGTSAAEIVNSSNRERLEKILWEFGEERFSRQIAKGIIDGRKKKRIVTVGDLVDIIEKSIPRRFAHGKIHFATRTFQALRIEANRELENVEEILNEIPNIIKPGGRVAIISFHSLEDRLVKNHFMQLEKEKKAIRETKKPIIPTEEEQRKNPRSRSAKLRIIKIIS